MTDSNYHSVVAVTGLAGHAFESWRNRESNRMWLQEFLPNNIKGIRIMTYGYNTEANTGRILDHRRDLVQQIQSARGSQEVVTMVQFFIAS